MEPTSPRSTPDGQNHHHRSLYHPDFEWTPPDSSSDDRSSTSHTQSWPGYQQPRISSHFVDVSDESQGPKHYERRHLDLSHSESRYSCFFDDDDDDDDDNNGSDNDHGVTELNIHHTNPTTMPRTLVPFPSPPLPLVGQTLLTHNYSTTTTASLSPIRPNNRLTRIHCPPNQCRHKQQFYPPNQCRHKQQFIASTEVPHTRMIRHRKRGPKIESVSYSCRDNSIPTATHDQLPLPPISSSSRSNKIYVRIKRVVTDKSTQSSASNGDSIPSVKAKQRMSHRHDSEDNSKMIGCNPSSCLQSDDILLLPSLSADWNSGRNGKENTNRRDVTGIKRSHVDDTDNDREGLIEEERLSGSPTLQQGHTFRCIPEDNDSLSESYEHSLQLTPISAEKVLMIQNLLDIKSGPISWCSTGEPCKPPASFVCYLANVLTERVQFHLTENIGKEFWIKHVMFWIDLLDPNSRWWNTREGLLYRSFAEQLFTDFRRRWEGRASFIDEFDKNDDIYKLFVRACILFARKNNNDSRGQHESVA